MGAKILEIAGWIGVAAGAAAVIFTLWLAAGSSPKAAAARWIFARPNSGPASRLKPSRIWGFEQKAIQPSRRFSARLRAISGAPFRIVRPAGRAFGAFQAH
jgi:hypothetical protein